MAAALPPRNAAAYIAAMTAFLKMHGLGNDFVVFDGRKGAILLGPQLARAVADRRLGIGCDQVIVMEPSKNGAAISMRILNADGGEVESCGNAARCIARLLMEEKDVAQVRIETQGGPLWCTDAGNGRVTVDIGEPRFDWEEIPLAEARDTNSFEIEQDGAHFIAAAVNVGNPHCILFVNDAEAARVGELGPKFERHPLFPARVNVEFASAMAPDRLRMRVWERGVGVTQACGTGACATAVAAHRRGLAGRDVDIVLDGGVLNIVWRAADDHILMTGPSSLSFEGEIDLASLERAL
jgi:diaminopimelate epimerase